MIIHFAPQKLAYFAVPKVANTSLRAWLLPLISDADYRTMRNIHQEVDWPRISKPQFTRIAAETFSFAVLRNPWERLVSTYVDKICRPQVHPALGAQGFEADMDFIDFAEKLATIRDRDADVHIRSQWAMITLDNRVLPDMVVDIGQIGKVFRVVGAWCGADALPGAPAHLNQTNSRSKFAKVLTSAAQHAQYRDIIARRYKREIALMGYTYPFSQGLSLRLTSGTG
ncbi:sulfotransferase family 2 domain-containing protein [Thalassococcus sp. BH17M4-6]|uniref:sulfotransferase family 2 domain-containing protein n=1 Tax=Thalassococcus sp. BH17M4-6 TaxID=3413148 RepID=UPI003BC5A910